MIIVSRCSSESREPEAAIAGPGPAGPGHRFVLYMRPAGREWFVYSLMPLHIHNMRKPGLAARSGAGGRPSPPGAERPGQPG